MTSDRICQLTQKGYNSFKFGWSRVNFNYFISPNEAAFICEAILQIAEHGWKLLPQYRIDPKSGLFVHKERAKSPNDVLGAGNAQAVLDKFSLAAHALHVRHQGEGTPTTDVISSFETVLNHAEQLYALGERYIQKTFRKPDVVLDDFTEALPEDLVSPDDIWWLTSQDIFDHLKSV